MYYYSKIFLWYWCNWDIYYKVLFSLIKLLSRTYYKYFIYSLNLPQNVWKFLSQIQLYLSYNFSSSKSVIWIYQAMRNIQNSQYTFQPTKKIPTKTTVCKTANSQHHMPPQLWQQTEVPPKVTFISQHPAHFKRYKRLKRRTRAKVRVLWPSA